MMRLFRGIFILTYSLLFAPLANSQSYTFSTLAGAPGCGSADGTGSNALFNLPSDVAMDSAGNLYVADTGNHTIRKITLGGGVSTLAGIAGYYGKTDGPGSTARFRQPTGVAVDGAGNIYVADTGNHTIRKITPAGIVSTLAGLAGYYGKVNGMGSNARFYNPKGLAVDGAGNVYVADSSNYSIRKITPEGIVSTLAGGSLGFADGVVGSAKFGTVLGVALDSAGSIYVADAGNNLIRKITSAGIVSTLAGLAGYSGKIDGAGSNARFYGPKAVSVDSQGNVYVADSYNHTIRRITPDGTVSTLAGWYIGRADGPGTNARFHEPNGVTVDNAGNVYVADTSNHTVRRIAPDRMVSTLAGNAGYGSADGVGRNAQFYLPNELAIDSIGNVYIADTSNHTIRKITPTGVVSTLAGLAGVSGSTNGTCADARFYNPRGVAVDGAGNIYVTDTSNFIVRKITPEGIVSTLAGLAGFRGSDDGTGSGARFKGLWGIAADHAGNLYVTADNTIRKITPGGTVTTIAGLAGTIGSADGSAINARFYGPQGIAVDNTGCIYVADLGNYTVRKITPDRTVSTLAGRPGVSGSADGIGTNAFFLQPAGVAVDTSGNVFVTDSYNNTIRKVTPGGVVSTMAGMVGVTGSEDGVSTNAWFYHPVGLAVDSAGNLYVADTENHTIRLGRPTSVPSPSLRFQFSSRHLLLSWPLTASSYVVETTTALSPSAAWTPLTNPIGTVGDNFVLTNTPDAPARFYRLRVP